MERVRPSGAIPHVAGLKPGSIPAIKAPTEQPDLSHPTISSIELATKELELAIISFCSRKVSSVKDMARMKRADATEAQVEAFIDYELASLAFASITSDEALPTKRFQNNLIASMTIKELQLRMLSRCS
jgi:hypothetical protein